MLYDGPYVLNEVAGQPGDDVWSIEVDGFVPHLDQVERVLTPDMQGEPAQGETLATVDESLGLGRLSRNGAEPRARASGPTCGAACSPRSRWRQSASASKAIELAIEYVVRARAVRQEDRHLPGDLAFARRRVRRGRARPLARVLGGVGRRRGRRAGRSRGRRGEVAGGRGGRARVREVDPGARRHRLHVGAPAAPLLQARALARGRTRVRPRAPRGDRRIPVCPRNGSVDRDRRGDGAPSRRAAAGRSTRRSAMPARRRRDDRARLRRHGRGRDRAAAAGIDRLDALVDNAGIAIAAPLEFLPPEELTRQLDVNVVGQLRVLQAFLPALREARGRIVLDGLDRRAFRAAVPRRLRDVEVRARGDGRRAAGRARAVGDARRDRRARDDRDADLDEAAAGGRALPPRGGRAVRRAARAVPARSPPSARRSARCRSRSWPTPSSTPSPPTAEDALPGRAGRKAARPGPAAPGPARDRVLTRFLFGDSSSPPRPEP